MELRDRLLTDFGIDFPISGDGTRNSRENPIIIHRVEPNDYTSVEYGVLRCLGLGRGIEWEVVEQRLLEHHGRTLDRLQIKTTQATDTEDIIQLENYYFDITECLARPAKDGSSPPEQEWVSTELKCPGCGVAIPPDAEHCKCGYDFKTQKTEKSATKESESSIVDPQLSRALKRIRNAWIAALVLAVVNGGVRMAAILSGSASLGESIMYAFDPVATLGLAMWMRKTKSPVAAVLLLVLYLFGKAALLVPLLGVDLDYRQQQAFAQAIGRQLFWIIVFGYAFIGGIRGTLTYRRLTSSLDPKLNEANAGS